MAFSAPHYFYEQSDPPDLVDVNGPIYARTGLKMDRVTPTEVESALIFAGNDEMPMLNAGMSLRVVSHDVHATKTCWSPRSGYDEDAILAVGLSGSITVENQTPVLPPTIDKPIIGLVLRISFQELNAGGTVQAPINVYAQIGGGDGMGEFLGTGLLKNPTNDGIYDGTTFASLVASLSPASISGSLTPTDPVVDIYFF